jgi:hypothetical protein
MLWIYPECRSAPPPLLRSAPRGRTTMKCGASTRTGNPSPLESPSPLPTSISPPRHAAGFLSCFPLVLVEFNNGAPS